MDFSVMGIRISVF